MDDGVVLEMTSPRALRASPHVDSLTTVPVGTDFARFGDLYREIWRPLGGGGRSSWTPDQWEAALNEPGNEAWLARLEGIDVGIAQIDWAGDGEAGIVVIGITPSHQGRGLGGDLVSRMTQRLWGPAPNGVLTTRVWIWTRPDEHPATIANYLARGYALAPEVPNLP